MTDSYREECLTRKRIREGVIDQREKNLPKKKKFRKPWTVYWSVFFDGTFFSIDRSFYPYRFATEEQAINYANKIRRSYKDRNNEPNVWVVDDTHLSEWRRITTECEGD